MSGLRSGGRVPVSQPQRRRIYPSLDPGPSLPPPHAGHTCCSTLASHALCRGTLELHPSPLPTEYEQQPAPVPSMEKKRTVYQMALSKMSQRGSLMPQSPPPYNVWECCLPSCVNSVLRALTPHFLHATYSPVLCHCWALPAGLGSVSKQRWKRDHLSSLSYPKAAGSPQWGKATSTFTVSL